MSLGKSHQSLKSFTACIASCRHIGIVHPQQFHPREVHLFQCFKVGLPAIVLPQIIVHNLCTENLAQTGIGRIPRIGHQHLITRVHKGQRCMQNTLLTAYQRLDFCLRIQRHTIPTLIESSHSLAQFRRPNSWLIAMSIRPTRHLAKLIYGLFRRWKVRTSNG